MTVVYISLKELLRTAILGLYRSFKSVNNKARGDK